MEGRPHPKHQHESFHGRVDLVRRQMNASDVSLVLRNVTSNDSGTYECRVQETDGTRRMIRSVISSPPVNTVTLMIDKSGEFSTRCVGNGAMAEPGSVDLLPDC